MITSLQLKSFKSFINQRIQFSPLTVLTGSNASGKSSVIQAIRIICQTYRPKEGSPILSDHAMLNQLKSKLTKDNFFSIEMSLNDVSYYASISSVQTDNFVLSSVALLPPIEIDYASYISADRLGPNNQLPIGNQSSIVNVGEKGEYVISFIEKNQYSKVPEQMRLTGLDATLYYNINEWLSVLSEDTKLTFNKNQTQNVFYPLYNGIVPTETGYGLSYTLPIITSLLFDAGKEQVLLIENPESHLHPFAQEKIGELIALSVSCGKQVIVETHSDHIIDGIRIMAKKKRINPSQVLFHFFTKKGFDQETRIESPLLLDDGKLSFWPKGFFDQGLIDKAYLARKG